MAVCRDCGSEDVVLYEDTEFGYATALTEIARLTAELAEARKPRWVWNPAHHSWGLVADDTADLVAYCWHRAGDHKVLWQIVDEDVAGVEETVAEAKAAAEKAVGVETE